MVALMRLLVVVFAFLLVTQVVIASDSPGAPSPAGMNAASVDALPVLLGQSSDSSSGGSTRIPRGLIRLVIFGVIALFGAGAWVVRQMSGS